MGCKYICVLAHLLTRFSELVNFQWSSLQTNSNIVRSKTFSLIEWLYHKRFTYKVWSLYGWKREKNSVTNLMQKYKHFWTTPERKLIVYWYVLPGNKWPKVITRWIFRTISSGVTCANGTGNGNGHETTVETLYVCLQSTIQFYVSFWFCSRVISFVRFHHYLWLKFVYVINSANSFVNARSDA